MTKHTTLKQNDEAKKTKKQGINNFTKLFKTQQELHKTSQDSTKLYITKKKIQQSSSLTCQNSIKILENL